MVQRGDRQARPRVVGPKDAAQEALAETVETWPVGVYRHRKGGVYVLYSHSLDEATLRPLIHYYSLKKRTRWTRTADDFGAVVRVRTRFTWVRVATVPEILEALGLRILNVPSLPGA